MPDTTNTTTNTTTTITNILTTALTTPRSSILPDQPSPSQLSLLQSLQTLHSTLHSTETSTSSTEATATATAATTTFLSPYPYHRPRPQWINLISFLAFATKERLLGLEGTAVGMLHAALERRAVVVPGGGGGGRGRDKGSKAKVEVEEEEEEEEKEKEVGGEVLQVLISCAAMWVLVMGEELWERCGGDGDGCTDTKTETQTETISRDTWRAWTDRFQFVSLREDLDLSTRDLAAEAAAVMLRVG